MFGDFRFACLGLVCFAMLPLLCLPKWICLALNMDNVLDLLMCVVWEVEKGAIPLPSLLILPVFELCLVF